MFFMRYADALTRIWANKRGCNWGKRGCKAGLASCIVGKRGCKQCYGYNGTTFKIFNPFPSADLNSRVQCSQEKSYHQFSHATTSKKDHPLKSSSSKQALSGGGLEKVRTALTSHTAQKAGGGNNNGGVVFGLLFFARRRRVVSG